MNINRNNYEEFFLLYVDNELSAAERKAVDLFVAENTDLQEELIMLQQTVLKPSAEIFSNKESLLKMDAALQEKLLLFLDAELNNNGKKEIESAILTDNNIAAEWKILQQTKLTADESIIFADKSSLYRKEPAKVVGIRWWRIAAAALLIGFGTWGTVSFLNNNKTSGIKTAAGEPGPATKEKTEKVNKVDLANAGDSVVSPAIQPGNDVKQQLVKTDLPDQKEKQTVPVKQVVKERPVVQENDNNTNLAKENSNLNKPTNNLPKPLENINNDPSNKTLIATVPLRKNEDIKVIPVNNDASSSSIDYSKTNTNASYAVNKTTNESADPEEETDDKKSKLRGLFRKVKRVFERNTNAKSGSNVMIAGFEIAVK